MRNDGGREAEIAAVSSDLYDVLGGDDNAPSLDALSDEARAARVTHLLRSDAVRHGYAHGNAEDVFGAALMRATQGLMLALKPKALDAAATEYITRLGARDLCSLIAEIIVNTDETYGAVDYLREHLEVVVVADKSRKVRFIRVTDANMADFN